MVKELTTKEDLLKALTDDEKIINILLGQNLCDWGVNRPLQKNLKAKRYYSEI